uniref:TGF-beta family profile domain-containing protein n=1 Tax=Cyclopterus lumpus TaxID=8103 RepID=A0A8C2ZT83_CYCLU
GAALGAALSAASSGRSSYESWFCWCGIRLGPHRGPAGRPGGEGASCDAARGGGGRGAGRRQKKKEKEEEEETGRVDRKGKGKSRQPKQNSRECHVEMTEMKVRDLGLGFDSDEIVLFKFCVGSCQSSRTNYDLALKALLENGSLPRHTARKVSNHPCCRPDQYETVSFMDAQNTWRTIQSLSAASCMCMG